MIFFFYLFIYLFNYLFFCNVGPLTLKKKKGGGGRITFSSHVSCDKLGHTCIYKNRSKGGGGGGSRTVREC